MEVEKKTMKVPVELLLKLTKHLDTIELLKCRLVHSSFNCPTHYKNIRSLTCFYYHRQIKELENLENLVCHSSHDEFDPHFFKFQGSSFCTSAALRIITFSWKRREFDWNGTI